jgi:hypothetical protein
MEWVAPSFTHLLNMLRQSTNPLFMAKARAAFPESMGYAKFHPARSLTHLNCSTC